MIDLSMADQQRNTRPLRSGMRTGIWQSSVISLLRISHGYFGGRTLAGSRGPCLEQSCRNSPCVTPLKELVYYERIEHS
jgi:hypothetical protein